MMSAAVTAAVMSGPTNTPSRVGLQYLPNELLSLIASCLEASDAVSLSRVSRIFTPSCDKIIWHWVDIYVDPYFGESPLVQPFARGTGRHKEWVKVEGRRAEALHQEEMNDQLIKMMSKDRRKLQMVKALTICPRVGSPHRLITFLEDLSRSVELLEIVGSPEYADENRYRDRETLDIHLISAKLSFTSLTIARLTSAAVQFLGLVPLICNSAPFLTSLLADITFAMRRRREGDSFPDFPPFIRDTRITELEMPSTSPSDELGGKDYPSGEAGRLICEIIGRSPRLQRLALDYYGSVECNARIVASCGAAPNLRDLHYALPHYDFCEFAIKLEVDESTGRYKKKRPDFPQVRRLALQLFNFRNLFDELPELPLLEDYYIRAWGSLGPPRPPILPTIPAAHLMLPEFAHSIRASPHLSRIHHIIPGEFRPQDSILSFMDETTTITGRIRSYKHGDEELLYACLLLHFFEIGTYPSTSFARGVPAPPGLETVGYNLADGTRMVKIFEERARPAWQHFTDFGGQAVPLGVIESMRAAQGASQAEWEGRGIIVGDAAWKVLTDWRDAHAA